jgi:N-alpha-acetyltransferase 35, NatC auxiliary subunit
MGSCHDVDVQPLLSAAQSALDIGELVAADTFRLHDAMLAIEIGDPKMDVGLRTGDSRSAAQRIAAGEAPTDLSPEAMQTVLDRLLAMEATWHTGSMLPQTVFTSLYLLDPEILRRSNPLLYAVCLGIRSCTTLCHDMVVAGQVCDEDDISMHAFGVRLDPPGQQPVTLALIALNEAFATAEARNGQAPAAVLPRLRFRLQLLRALSEVHQATSESLKAASVACDAACRELDDFLSSALAEDVLAGAPGFAPEVHRRAMGMVPPRNVVVLSFDAAVAHWRSLLQGLATACRWLIECSGWEDLRAGLVQFAAQSNHALIRSAVYRAISVNIQRFQPPSAPNACGDGGEPATASEHCSKNGGAAHGSQGPAPAWAPTQATLGMEFGWKDGVAPGELGKVFLEQLCIAVQGWCHTLCLNRCRQRRRLRRLVEDWRNMTDHAFSAESSAEVQQWFLEHGWRWAPFSPEGFPVAGPIAAWVELQACRTMLLHLMLGAPLDLYAPYELVGLYWYCDYLLNAAQQAFNDLEGMRPTVNDITSEKAGGAVVAKTSAKKAAKGKKKDKKVTISVAPEHAAAEERRTATVLASHVDRFMCQAMLRVTLALRILGLAAPPAESFSTEKERFEQRFGCFAQLVRPDALKYADFETAVEGTDSPPEQLLVSALESFARAQAGVATLTTGPVARALRPEESRHLMGLTRILRANSLAIRLLLEAATETKAGQRPPFRVAWDYQVALQHSTTAYFPSLIIKRA